MNEQFESTLKSRKRALTRFLAQELLFDFVEGRLDAERKLAVETSLEESKDLQKGLQSLSRAEAYLQQLSEMQISEGLVGELASTETGWTRKLNRFSPKNWPEMARWSFEALIISVVVASLVSLLPLRKLNRWLPLPAQEYILAKVDSGQRTLEVPEDEDLESPGPTAVTGNELIASQLNKNLGEKPRDANQKTSAVQADHVVSAQPPNSSMEDVKATGGSKASSGASSNASSGAKVGAIATVKDESKVDSKTALKPESKPESKPELKPESKSESKGESRAESPVAGSRAQKVGVAAKADQSLEVRKPLLAKGPKGFVYRAFMATASIDDATNTVRETVEKLGGEKAGQVELGMRKSNGSYFHFSLPESNYEELLASLRNLGPVRIYKDPHWREMPDGQIRIILFVEDQAAK